MVIDDFIQKVKQFTIIIMNITEQKLKLKQEKRGLIKKLKKGFK